MSPIVICDKKDYLNKCELQLGNKSIDKKAKRDPSEGVTQKIRNTLLDMLIKKELDKQLFSYFLLSTWMFLSLAKDA